MTKYIKVKDLEVGRLYGDWGNWHIYLGRTKTKGFIWVYIGNVKTLRNDSYKEIWFSLNQGWLQITKQNKKIQLTDGFEDFKLNINDFPDKLKYILGYRGLNIK